MLKVLLATFTLMIGLSGLWFLIWVFYKDITEQDKE